MVEESIHPEESCNGQIFRKAGSNVDDSAGYKEHDVVEIVARRSIDAEGLLDRSFFDFQADKSANASMKNTARGTRVYYCLEAFRAGCIPGGQRDADIQRCAVGNSTAVQWILFVR